MIGFAQSGYVRRAPKRTNRDGLDVEQRDWANAVDTAASGVNLQPVGSRESFTNDVRQVVSTWVLITAPGSGDFDIQVGDRWVTDTDRVLDVVAEPERWPSLSGGVDHVEALLILTPPGPGAGGDSTAGQRATGTGGAATGLGWRP